MSILCNMHLETAMSKDLSYFFDTKQLSLSFRTDVRNPYLTLKPYYMHLGDNYIDKFPYMR